ncbi:MAG: MBL fold metallo-hydrolase [Clostridiales bacterium]|nr:MBL fold metallo-hydrolase [Clostridiales bacterium]
MGSDQQHLLRGVKKLSQAGVRFDKGAVLYVDPFGLLSEAGDATYILLTHAHHDHYSPADIRKVVKADTVFVVPPDLAGQIREEFGEVKIKEVAPGDILSLGRNGVEVLPAYNLDKPFHPRENNWVGYILRTDDGSYYLPGDTDVTPEFLQADADVFFVPIGGTYTMDVEQAAAAINQIRPKLVVPFHYGDLEGVGRREDGERFLSLLDEGIAGIIL